MLHQGVALYIEQIMEELEYDCLYHSENVSQYVSPLQVFGEVDFLHAFREASTGMLRNAVEKSVFEPGFSVRVLRPEDLVGLKLQALKNNPDRRRDIDDIRALLGQSVEHIDRDKVARYVEILGAEEVYLEVIGGMDESDA